MILAVVAALMSAAQIYVVDSFSTAATPTLRARSREVGWVSPRQLTHTSIVGRVSSAAAEFGAPETTSDTQWNLWPVLPLAPYGRRKTLMNEVIKVIFF